MKSPNLPIKGDLKLLYRVSLLIAVLMTVASISGLVFSDDAYPTEAFVQSFVPNDVVNLVVGLPTLLLSMWLVRRGKLTGLLCWPGALFYILYNYMSYIFALPLSWIYLLNLILVMLSLYTLVLLLSRFEGSEINDRLTGHVSEKFSGVLLAGLGILILIRVAGLFVGELIGGDPVGKTDFAVSLSDFLTLPAYVVGGLLLWRRHAFGYMVGLGLLFQASMLFIALIILMLLQPILTNALFAPVDILVVLVMGLICFVPFGLYWRGAARVS